MSSSLSREESDMQKLEKIESSEGLEKLEKLKIEDSDDDGDDYDYLRRELEGLREEAIITQPLRSPSDLSSLIKKQCKIIPRQAQKVSNYQGLTSSDIKYGRVILIPVILSIYFIYTITSMLATFIILYFPMIYKFEFKLWKKVRVIRINRKNQNFISFLAVTLGSILIPVLILFGNIIFMIVVIGASLGAAYKALFKSFDEGLEYCGNVAMSIPESYLEMIFDCKV